jgi:hypothetical protein
VGWTAVVDDPTAYTAAVLLVPGKGIANPLGPTESPEYVLLADDIQRSTALAAPGGAGADSEGVVVALETEGPGLRIWTPATDPVPAAAPVAAAAAVLVLPRTLAVGGSAWWRPADHGGPWREYRIAGRWSASASSGSSILLSSFWRASRCWSRF